VKYFCAAIFMCLSLLGIERALGSPDSAQQVDTKLLQELRWRSIGPARGGRVLAVTGVRGQAEVYYFGAVGGGVWRSNDAGRTWKPIFDAQGNCFDWRDCSGAFQCANHLCGTGESDMRSDIAYGNGMYRSADGGKTWTHIGLEDSRQIARILVDPRGP